MLFPRLASAALATLALAAPLAASAPAHALDAPVAVDDVHFGHQRGVVVTDVLGNDSWDGAHTATLTDVTLLATHLEDSYGDPLETAPTVSWDPAGEVTVDFGAYSAAYPAPSLLRQANLSYTITDSAGQSSTAFLVVTDSEPDTPLTAADDTFTGDQWEGNQGTWRSVLRNDTYGVAGNVPHFGWEPARTRLEVLTQPQHGTVDETTGQYNMAPVDDADYVTTETVSGERRDYTAPISDSFTYRLCTTDGTSCSAPATATVDYRVYRSAQLDQNHLFGFYWVGGPTTYTFEPAFLASPVEANLTGTTMSMTTLDAGYGTLVDNGDGSWTHSFANFPALPGANPRRGGDDRYVFTWTDGSGEVVAKRSLSLTYQQAPAAWPAGDDELWATAGSNTQVSVPYLLNDAPDRNLESLGGGWIGSSEDRSDLLFFRADVVAGGDLASTRNPGSTFATTFRDSGRFYYTPGDTPGTDNVTLRVCPPYPGSDYCVDQQITVHVSPRAAASNDDSTATVAGEDVTVPVLDNDTYTDTPTTTAAVTLLDVPAGIDAVVNADRTVTVTAPADYPEQDLQLGYRLADYTGTTDAAVTVHLTYVAGNDDDTTTPDTPDTDDDTPTTPGTPDTGDDTPAPTEDDETPTDGPKSTTRDRFPVAGATTGTASGHGSTPSPIAPLLGLLAVFGLATRTVHRARTTRS